MSNTSVCSREDCVHQAIADRLQALTGGAVQIQFDANLSHDEDEGSRGHLYFGFTSPGQEEVDFVFLDDRGPEPLEVQLIHELRRVSDYFRTLANGVAPATTKKTIWADREWSVVIRNERGDAIEEIYPMCEGEAESLAASHCKWHPNHTAEPRKMAVTPATMNR